MSPAYPQSPRHAPAQQGGGFVGHRPHDSAPPPIRLDDIKFGESLDPNLFADVAQAKAKAIAEEGRGRKNKSTQLRKFYDELVMWHDKVFLARDDTGKTSDSARKKEYDRLAPFIKMLCAKVTYAEGRDHVSKGFEKFFTHIIRAVKDPETLKHAKLFMEAFMGFYKAEEKDK
ncbi:MAG: type III-A CRISPR-associated protein Csm2 [Candidatus Accumulibacter sp.]|jgi:CRISPR-associated protein Csm2|nr:type III-A CRISPR-associated protein Csm2 [Accumulibacter sp.]